MKKLLLLFVMLGVMLAGLQAIANDDKTGEDQLLRKSLLLEPSVYEGTSFPYPFSEIANPDLDFNIPTNPSLIAT